MTRPPRRGPRRRRRPNGGSSASASLPLPLVAAAREDLHAVRAELPFRQSPVELVRREPSTPRQLHGVDADRPVPPDREDLRPRPLERPLVPVAKGELGGRPLDPELLLQLPSHGRLV